jgi:hypothetical protein
VAVGLAIALILLAAWAVDRRSRRRGHNVRGGGLIARDVREQNRDHQAADAQEYLNPDRSWTHRARQAKDRNAP